MTKRKRFEPVKSKNTGGPIDETTGQRSVFPQVVSLSGRDSEWRYDEDRGEADNDDGVSETKDFVNQTYSSDMSMDSDEMEMGHGSAAVENDEEEENEVSEVEEDEWE